jgi:diacylglycerol kinase family enzyme
VTRRPILLIVNPESGGKPGSGADLATGDAGTAPEAIAERLRARGLEVALHVLGERDDVSALASRAADEGRDVVAAGGDGTVGPAAVALAGHPSATLGIVASGSFNNVARGLGIPAELDPALDVIAAGDAIGFDAGWAYRDDPAEGRLFLEAAGVGVDAIGFLAVEIAERHGWRRAARALWRGLRRRRTRMAITLDGVALRTRSPAVTVCNGPYHGLGFALAPDADPTDGRLTVAIFWRMSALRVLRHFLAVARRRTRSEPRVRLIEARRVTVKGLRGALPVHADGESIGVTPVTFEVRPAALRVFARPRHRSG